MKILNFGSCNIDYVYSLDHIVHTGETASSDKMEIFPGGKGLNQSIAAARAGASVYHAGYIGNDGKMLYDILSESNVDVSCLKRADIKNGHAVIQVDKNGENSIFIHKGTNGIISCEFIDEVLEKFSTNDILMLQNEINNVPYIVDKAYDKGIRIVLNPSPFNDSIKEINISKLTYLILNQVEAKCFTGQDKTDSIISFMKNKYPHLKMVLTLGKKGCVYSDRDRKILCPAFDVNAVDTTAAGDTFTGYFVALTAKGLPCNKAIKYASAASAIAVTRMGAAPSIPLLSEVEAALKVLNPIIV